MVKNTTSHSSWRPDLLWRVLRLTDEYQKAYETFAKNCSDRALYLSEKLSGIEADKSVRPSDSIKENSHISKKPRVVAKRKPRQKAISERFVGKEFNEIWSSFVSANDLFDILNEKSLREFTSIFGHILRYPLHPSSKEIPVECLYSCWRLSPTTRMFGTLQRDKYQSSFYVNEEEPKYGFINLSIGINLHFSTELILEELRKTLSSLPHQPYALIHPKSKTIRSLKFKWELIEDCVKIFEFISTRQGLDEFGKKIGSSRIGQQLCPRKASLESKKKWAEHRQKILKKTLIPLLKPSNPR